MIGKVLAVGLVCAGMAMGQTATAPVASTAAVDPAASGAAAAPAKAYTFDVVSIRQNNTPLRGQRGIPQSGPTADGYRLTNDNLLLVLLAAYVPQAGGATFYGLAQIKGIPDWSERYDIDARISDTDRAAWQNPAEQKVMLQAMLQAMLADRCKLAVHREIKEGPVYMLVVDKGGPKFKVTDPTVEHPGGMPMPWGGVLFPGGMNGDGMRMYGASMTTFASYVSSILSNMGLKRSHGSGQDRSDRQVRHYDKAASSLGVCAGRATGRNSSVRSWWYFDLFEAERSWPDAGVGGGPGGDAGHRPHRAALSELAPPKRVNMKKLPRARREEITRAAPSGRSRSASGPASSTHAPAR